jgi:hypothetical protein
MRPHKSKEGVIVSTCPNALLNLNTSHDFSNPLYLSNQIENMDNPIPLSNRDMDHPKLGADHHIPY